MKTVKINLDEFRPNEKVRIEFLREVQFRVGSVLMFLAGSPLFALICGFGISKEGGPFVNGLYIISMLLLILLPIILSSLFHRKRIYQLLFPYIDKSYKWVSYDYEHQQLIFSQKKFRIKPDPNDLGAADKILWFNNISRGILWFPTSRIKAKRRGNDPLLIQLLGIPYFCIIWPLFVNPLQLAFLEYDKLKKYIDKPKGLKILILGAGAIPHHIRYKNWIGAEGELMVTDNHIPSLWMSKSIEYLYEMIYKLFRISRAKVQYKVVDSTETFPFGDDSFDVIVGIRNYNVDYDECKRVLKENGVMYFTNLGEWFCNEPVKENVKVFGDGILVC
ncbi:class I SAM-dependent methyltransferase [Candidatus Gracilibacteria bacterium]|nr:class I SAM-dependent methyltransferase [Candidatus Gracilibacteria bacterium]